MLNLIEKMIVDTYKFLRIDGTVTKTAERQARINMFNADRSFFCFLLTTGVGGLGINLTSADRVIICKSLLFMRGVCCVNVRVCACACVCAGAYGLFCSSIFSPHKSCVLCLFMLCIVVDPAWTPIDDQAVDRVYRIGQTRDVVVYRLITCGTIEEKIYRKQVTY